MRSYMIGFAAMVFSISVFSQTGANLDNVFDYKSELQRMANIPNSPEAFAFTKYGDIPASLYTGSPNVNIPIYTIQGKEMSLPLALTYDHSSVKVEQQATWVGLGWNLDVGGRITRIANGLPDDYFAYGIQRTIFDLDTREKIKKYTSNNSSFNSSQEVIDYFNFLKDASKNKVDLQPDFFSLNVLGINDYVVIDLGSPTLEAKALNNPRVKVEYTIGQANGVVPSIDKFIVTDESGTKYYFESSEKTYTVNSDAESSLVFQNYVSSWLLTKIVSPTGKDVFEFTYKSMPKWQQPYPITPVTGITHTFEPNDFRTFYDVDQVNGSFSFYESDVYLEQKFLTSITLNGKQVATFSFVDRFDTDIELRNTGLSKIDIFDFSGGTVRSVDFNYSYFGLSSGQSPTSKPFDEIRLKLDKVNFLNKNQSIEHAYKLDYLNPSQMPSRRSLSQDYMGYYNGASNSVLYPRMEVSGITFAGANRNPVASKASIGLLNKITYPTGGSSVLEYEPHGIPFTPDTAGTINVTYGSLGIGSSTPVTTDCGPCCKDKFQTAPKEAKKKFYINEAGIYNINYSTTGNSEAYIFKTTDILSYSEIVNSTCIIEPEVIWMEFYNISGSTTETVYLQQGWHQMTLINGKLPGISGVQPGTSSLKVSREELNTALLQSNEEKAGMRIKKITDYQNDGQLSIQKEFRYTNEIKGTLSSGKVIYDPLLYYYTSRTVYDSGGGLSTSGFVSKTTLHRQGGNPNSNLPHVVYSKVFEVRKSFDGSATNGYTEFEYNTGRSGLNPLQGPPFSNGYETNPQTGQEKRSAVYNQNNALLAEKSSTYQTGFFFSRNSIALENNENRIEDFPAIHFDSYSQKWKYEFLRGRYLGFGGPTIASLGGSGSAYLTPPIECGDPNYTCLNSEYSIFGIRKTNIKAEALSSTETFSKEFFYQAADTNIVSNVTRNVFDPAVKYLQRENTNVSSLDTIQFLYQYPADYPSDPALQSLVVQNKLNYPVNINKIFNGKLVRQRLNTYNSKGIIQTISLGKDNNIESLIDFTYDGFKNLKESFTRLNINTQQPSLDRAVTSSYIWGYNQTYPIAKIDNIEYASIPSNLITAAVNASNADNDRTNGTNGNEGALRTALQAIRAALPNAQVTSYTYDPLVGVTSITDPGGYTSYYQYDDFNRLKFVKNKDSAIQQQYRYNYRLDELVATTTPSASSVSSGTTVIFTTNASGGSGNFSYKWTVSNANFTEVTTTTTGIFPVTTILAHTPSFTLTCEITDTQTGEKITNTVQVTVSVSYPPLSLSNIAISPSSDNKAVGNNVQYSISVSGGSGNYKYGWSKTNSQNSTNYLNNTNTQNIRVVTDDCTQFTVQCFVLDLTTGQSVTKTIQMYVNSGCTTGGNQ